MDAGRGRAGRAIGLLVLAGGQTTSCSRCWCTCRSRRWQGRATHSPRGWARSAAGPGRWLTGVVVTAISLLLLSIGSALTWFFVGGSVATVAILVIGGVWAWILTRLWARWYLGARHVAPQPDPAGRRRARPRLMSAHG